MKRLILTSLFVALVVNAFSQEIKNDTVFVSGDNVEVLINNNKVKISDSPNGLKINVFTITEDGEVEKDPYYESRYENDINNVKEKRNITVSFPIIPTFIKDDKHVNDDKGTKLKFRYFEPIYPTIYYAYSAMFDTDDFMMQPQRANSFEWGSYFSQVKIYSNKKNTFGLTAAIGVSNTYNFSDYILGTHKNPTGSGSSTYFYYGDEGQVIPDGMENILVDVTSDYKKLEKSYLRYWSLRIPISAQFKWRVGYKKMAFSLGPELEWRFAARSKVKFEDIEKRTVSDNLAYNPLGVNVLAVFAFEDFVIFGRAGLTQMFNQQKSHITVVPCNLGIGFSF